MREDKVVGNDQDILNDVRLKELVIPSEPRLDECGPLSCALQRNATAHRSSYRLGLASGEKGGVGWQTAADPVKHSKDRLDDNFADRVEELKGRKAKVLGLPLVEEFRICRLVHRSVQDGEAIRLAARPPGPANQCPAKIVAAATGRSSSLSSSVNSSATVSIACMGTLKFNQLQI